jgi:hypothetical protein
MTTGKFIIYFRTSTRADKKWMVTITHGDDRHKTVHFGGAGYEDYTIHKDIERKRRYEARHKERETWTKSGIKTAGFWSKWILWNKPSLSASISDTSNRFGIKIIKKDPPSK